MRHFIIVALFFITCGEVAAQQFPVNCFKMYSAVTGETPLTHTQQIAKTFPLYQNASFNWGLPFINTSFGNPNPTISDAQILQLLDSAAAHSMKIILPDVVSNYTKAQRFYLDADSSYFSYIRTQDLDPNNGDTEVPSAIYRKTSLKATIANDYMVKDVKYGVVHPWPNYCNKYYYAHFRLKVLRSGSPDPLTPVVDIEVWDSTSHSSCIKKTLLSQDFSSDNIYYTFPLLFHSSQYCVQSAQASSSQAALLAADENMPLDLNISSAVCYPHTFDVRVKWYGQIQVWLDNIRMDSYDNDPLGLFSGVYDAQIKTNAKKFNAHSALGRFYLKDEPYMSQFLASDKVNKVLKIAAQENGITPGTGKGLGYTAKAGDDPNYGTYSRFTQEATPYELATDIYRFREGDPLPSDPNYTSFAQNAYQTETDQFRSAQQNCVYSESGMWQYFPNISRWAGSTREPYLTEVFAQVNLALAYGAKGIHYFHYWTKPDTSANFPIGLIDPATLDPINSTSQYSLYQENKWDGIKSLNQKLVGSMGTTLLNLTWQKAFSIQQGQPTGTCITSVVTPDAVSERFVEVGMFKDVSNNDYFMIVNRRTKTDENRDITITFNNAAFWNIAEVATGGRQWIVGLNGTYTDIFSPGEGKLYKISPMSYNWDGNITVMNTVTAPSGTTLTVNAGTTLRFLDDYEDDGVIISTNMNVSGKLLINGTASQPVTITSLNGGSWGSINISGSTAQHSIISYAHIQNATEIFGFNVPNWGVQVRNCTIENTINGVRLYNTNAWVIECTITNPRDHGIVAVNGATAACYSNVIAKTDHSGFGILYGGGSSDYCWKNNISGFNQGIGAIWGSSPTLGHPANTGINNHITNCLEGLEIYISSYPLIGYPPDWDDGATFGNNIYNNTLAARVFNCPDDNILAENVYWGTTDPVVLASLFSLSNVYNFDYNDPLYSCTWDSQQRIATIPTGQAQVESLTKSVDGVQSSDEELLSAGIKLPQDGKYADAKEYFISVIKKNPEKAAAYIELYKTRNDTTSNDLLSFFASLPAKAPPVAKFLLSSLYLKKGDISSAKQVNTAMIKQYPNSKVSAHARLNNFYIALYNENNPGQAESILNEVLKESTTSMETNLSLANQALAIYKGMKNDNGDLLVKENPEKTIVSNPTKFELAQNYPNPFNPSTVISYQLSVVSHVILKIYDMLGREVATLADGTQKSGYYTKTFDASKLATGVYFAHFIAQPENSNQPYVQVKKLLMTK